MRRNGQARIVLGNAKHSSLPREPNPNTRTLKACSAVQVIHDLFLHFS